MRYSYYFTALLGMAFWLMPSVSSYGSTVVIAGHFHGIFYADVDNEALRSRVVKSINAREAKASFLLGDFVHGVDEFPWEKVNAFVERIKTPIFYSPGNHDYRYESDKPHHLWAPYRALSLKRNEVVVVDGVKFLCFDSVVFDDEVKEFLTQEFSTLDEGQRVVLLSHFCFWQKQYGNWAFFTKEMKAKVLCLFAGNSRYDGMGYAYDEVDGLPAYKIGMGALGRGAVSYVTYDVGTQEVTPHYISTKGSAWAAAAQGKGSVGGLRMWVKHALGPRYASILSVLSFIIGLGAGCFFARQRK